MMARLKQFVPTPLKQWAKRLLGPGSPNYARIWQQYCQHWLPGSADIDATGVSFTGWAVVPESLRPHVGFTINGRAFDEIKFPFPQRHVAELLPFVPGSLHSAFECRATFRPDFPEPSGPVTLRCVDRRTGTDLGASYMPWHLNHTPEDALVPDQVRRDRVIGAGPEFNFRVGGYTTYRRLQDALISNTGNGFESFPRVLDWGCGCGRVTRYLTQLDGTRVTGVDVDADNIDWCRSHLPTGTFEPIPLRPPTAFPDESFDSVIGVSVFTHLIESDQFLWLEELRRITRPGAVLMLSFHGEGSLLWARIPESAYAQLRRHGITDVPNHLYDADLPQEDYYRDTFHTERYVRENWGRYFRVLEIRHHYLSHQDLVILRRE